MAPDDFSPCQADLDAFEMQVLPRADLGCFSHPFCEPIPTVAERSVLYSVPCPRPFYQAAGDLARSRSVEVADLVRMCLLMVAPAIREGFADPGSGLGVAALPPPVLKLMLPPGLDHRTIRQCLAAMLALASPLWRLTEVEERARFAASVDRVRERNRTLNGALDALAFEPLPDGPRTVEEAGMILGLAGPQAMDRNRIASRFRTLARIFHPDAGLMPSTLRMAQVIEARNILMQRVRARA